VKPVKYSHHSSHLSEDPKSFKSAITGNNAEGWVKAIEAELDTIEDHDVWVDHWVTPPKYLNGTWVF